MYQTIKYIYIEKQKFDYFWTKKILLIKKNPERLSNPLLFRMTVD